MADIHNTYVNPNSISLTQNLMELNINYNLKLIALNVKDLYVNISVNKKHITKYFLQHYNTDKTVQSHYTAYYSAPNYFQLNENFIKHP